VPGSGLINTVQASPKNKHLSLIYKNRMSAINLLLGTAIDYERTHQIILHTLLCESNLGSHLLNTTEKLTSTIEPEGGLFDLAINENQNPEAKDSNNKYHIFLELKMWSSLSNNQIKRQTDFLQKEEKQGYYILLGSS
jgi:hypothetical protein